MSDVHDAAKSIHQTNNEGCIRIALPHPSMSRGDGSNHPCTGHSSCIGDENEMRRPECTPGDYLLVIWTHITKGNIHRK